MLLESLARPEDQRPEGLRLTLPDGRRVFISNDRLTPLLDLIADLETAADGSLGLPRARIAALDPAPDWRFMPSPEIFTAMFGQVASVSIPRRHRS